MIGWYVHHHGAGHRHRMRAVTDHLVTPVTVLSSLQPGPTDPRPWLVLPRDDDTEETVDDPTGQGVLHWVPKDDRGLRERMAMISAWIRDERPSLVVVDVSVEITLLARLHGVPVVVVGMQGDRGDRAHRAAYDVAEALLVPWPKAAIPTDWPGSWHDKSWATGGISRFDERFNERFRSDGGRADDLGAKTPGRPGTPRTILLLWGGGGADIDSDHLACAQAATPKWSWNVVGFPGFTRVDVWNELMAADVVICHAGQNVVAEVAAARRPAVVVAQSRPHGEQRATSRVLDRLGIVHALDAWPSAHRWPLLLDDALLRGGQGWSLWSSGHGALDAATRIEELATSLVGSRAVATRCGATSPASSEPTPQDP